MDDIEYNVEVFMKQMNDRCFWVDLWVGSGDNKLCILEKEFDTEKKARKYAKKLWLKLKWSELNNEDVFVKRFNQFIENIG